MRELDARIAEGLGYEVEVKRSHTSCYERYYRATKGIKVLLAHYSTDPAAMLELDEEMRKRGYCKSVFIYDDGHKDVKYWNSNKPIEKRYGTARGKKTQQHLSCLAAHKALYGTEWEGA